MRKFALVLGFLLTAPVFLVAQTAASSRWQATVDQDLPLLGHRNWILIVDSAYPLQSSPGIETVETNADQLDVVRYVLGRINNSIHVRPDIFMDAELPYVQEEDAPGTSAYRDAIAKLLEGQNLQAQSELHEKLIAGVDQSGQVFHVLVLKTRLTVPYSSVFIRLNCKYWGDDAEERLRSKMGTPEPGVAPVPQPQPAQPAPPPQEQSTPPAGSEPGTPPAPPSPQ